MGASTPSPPPPAGSSASCTPGHGPFSVPGLWGLRFPTGSLNGVPGALYFTAGVNHESDGLFGDIIPNP